MRKRQCKKLRIIAKRGGYSKRLFKLLYPTREVRQAAIKYHNLLNERINNSSNDYELFTMGMMKDISESMGVPAGLLMSEPFTSNAEWPDSVSTGRKPNVSTDTHEDRQFAQSICDRLESHGFGGDGKIFPIRTWVGSPGDIANG